MNKFFIFALMILFSAGLNAQEKMKTAAVLDFQNKGDVTRDESSILSNRFRGLLVESKAFTVLERDKMADILREQDFILSDNCRTSECAVQVGQLLGVEYMIAGEIGKLRETYTVDVRMIDVTTGEIFKSVSGDFSGKIDGLLEAMFSVVSDLTGTEKSAVKNKRLSPGRYTDLIASIELVYVSGDTFLMGHDHGEPDEKPAHWVLLDDYYIGQYEVTHEQWKTVMNTQHVSFSGCDSCPVDYLSWNEAQSFIKMLNQKSGKKYRLAYEAEWEFAARGGKRSGRYLYSGSDNIDDVAWYDKNSGGKARPVGQKQPNEIDLHDMSGNVAEWCMDWYTDDYYKSASFRNPSGPKSSASLNRRVIRGGAWNDGKDKCRVIARKKNTPSKNYDGYGLRIVHPALGLFE